MWKFWYFGDVLVRVECKEQQNQVGTTTWEREQSCWPIGVFHWSTEEKYLKCKISIALWFWDEKVGRMFWLAVIREYGVYDWDHMEKWGVSEEVAMCGLKELSTVLGVKSLSCLGRWRGGRMAKHWRAVEREVWDCHLLTRQGKEDI